MVCKIKRTTDAKTSLFGEQRSIRRLPLQRRQRSIVYLNNNETRNFSWKKSSFGEQPQIYEDNNTFGDLSAILIENMPIWAEFSSTPNNRISLMSNGKQRYVLLMKLEKNHQFCWCPFLDACPDE
jgi:hypothetical protein